MPALRTSTVRVLAVESAISVVPNSLGGGLIAWFVFFGVQKVSLWRMNGLAFDLLLTTFLLTLLTTAILTVIIGKRVLAGKIERESTGRFELHRNVLVRTLTLALAMVILFVPLTLLLLAITWGNDFSLPQVIAFKVIYCTSLGLTVTPLAVLAGLRDR
jgi:hypothetical protein